MKKFIFFAMILYAGKAMAQPKIITQATINTTTTVIAPEEEDVTTIQNQGSGGAAMFRNFGDGETKSVTLVKNEMVKTVMKSDMGRSTIIRNNETKLTSLLIEMMGNKSGFYATDEEQADMKKRMDSMMQARTKDSAVANTRRPQQAPQVEISYTGESKKIAGYDCKKAYLINTRFLGIKDTAIVWFTPDFKINNVVSTGGGFSMGLGNTDTGLGGLEKIDGFIMRYETKMRRNRTMIVEVTKVDITKEITVKDFDIPKDFDMKPMKEMRNMMRGGGAGGQGNQIIIQRSN